MSNHKFGFTLVEEKPLPDIQAVAQMYHHDQTGAQVLYLKNQDSNKAFTIAFRTPPYDDNGIAHIIEHSVLNGSKKYPTKEPFVELLKGSLKTFLNALTYSDKTVYPVASQNQKDFENLMSVYLDAVFYPNLVHDPQIMMQEGWHYHLEKPEDELIYKGVVYNEMRGAFSQPESEMFRLVEPALFPDTIYQHISGGLPSEIPTLTQEKFVKFHQTYYHPSNARVTLYGDLDLDQALQQLAEYFDAFDKQEIPFVDFEQQPFEKRREIHRHYSISSGESTENKALMTLAWATGRSTHGEEVMALGILDEILLGSNTAPLKKALLKAGIASDIMGGYAADIYTPAFEVMLKDTDVKHQKTFETIVHDELTRLVTEGIPKKLVQAALNKVAFRQKEFTTLEGSTPKGILYAFNALSSWLYDGSPYVTLEYQHYLDHIQSELDNGYFEALIEKYFLQNTHSALITLEPEPGLGEKREKALAEKLAAYKASLSIEEIQEIVDQTQALITRQSTPDSPEALATIPTLSLDDVDRKAPEYPLTVAGGKETPTFLHYEDFTAGISYVKYYFDMRGVKTEDLPVASFLTELLGEVATEKFSDEDLNTEIDFYTGGISTNTTVISRSVVDHDYSTFFTVSGKVMERYLPKLVELMEEILLHSKLEDVDKLKEILLNTKAAVEMNFNFSSHAAAASRLQSYYDESATYSQALSGIDYYDYLVALVENFEERKESFVADLNRVLKTMLTAKGVTASFVGSQKDFETFKAVSENFFRHLGQHEVEVQPFTTPVEVKNEGFKTAQEVQYVAKGYHQTLLGVPYNGMNVFLSTILGLDYLWNTVRVKGGAYGGMSFMDAKGNVQAVSYRDPNLVETLAAYDGQSDYLANYNPTSEEFEKNMIGTFSKLDTPLSANQKGSIAFHRYFANVTQAYVQEKRDEVFATTPEKVRAYAETMKKINDQHAFVVIGQDVKIEKHKDIFKNVRNLF